MEDLGQAMTDIAFHEMRAEPVGSVQALADPAYQQRVFDAGDASDLGDPRWPTVVAAAARAAAALGAPPAAVHRADLAVLRRAFPLLEQVTDIVDPESFAIADLWYATV